MPRHWPHKKVSIHFSLEPIISGQFTIFKNPANFAADMFRAWPILVISNVEKNLTSEVLGDPKQSFTFKKKFNFENCRLHQIHFYSYFFQNLSKCYLFGLLLLPATARNPKKRRRTNSIGSTCHSGVLSIVIYR